MTSVYSEVRLTDHIKQDTHIKTFKTRFLKETNNDRRGDLRIEMIMFLEASAFNMYWCLKKTITCKSNYLVNLTQGESESEPINRMEDIIKADFTV